MRGFEGIEVSHEDGRTTWIDGDWTYSFEFDAAQYRTEVERARAISTALLDAVTDERVSVDSWDRQLFSEWNESTELVMHNWEQEYQRRRGLPDLPGERSGTRLHVAGCWYGLRLLIRTVPGAAWHMFKEQRKAERRWLRARLGRGQRD
jgi:hypothetical protein